VITGRVLDERTVIQDAAVRGAYPHST
jgi:hypothetical protein